VVSAGLRDEELAARAPANPMAVLAELERIDPARLILARDFQTFGVASAVAGDPALAGKFLEAGVRQNPENVVLRLNLGTVLPNQGRREVAAGGDSADKTLHLESDFRMSPTSASSARILTSFEDIRKLRATEQ
jgi:hypothetical protein